MRKFSFLRRPVRLILYAALMMLLSMAALVFAWQYKVDGLMLDYAMDTYAYLGTVVRSDGPILDNDEDRDLAAAEDDPELGGPAFVEPIPTELADWLAANPHVARVDCRTTQAAILGNVTESILILLPRWPRCRTLPCPQW